MSHFLDLFIPAVFGAFGAVAVVQLPLHWRAKRAARGR